MSSPAYLSVISTPPIKYSDFSVGGEYAVTVTLNVKDGLQTRLNNIAKTFPKAPTSHVIETIDGPVVVPGLPETNKDAITINESVGISALVDILTGPPETLKQYGYGENELMSLLTLINRFASTNANKPTASSVGSALIGNFRPYSKTFSGVEITRSNNSFVFFAQGHGEWAQPKNAMNFATLEQFLMSTVFYKKGSHGLLFTHEAGVVLPSFERSKYRPGGPLNLHHSYKYGKNLGTFFELLLNAYEQTSELPPASTGDALELEKIFMRKAKKIVEALPFQTDLVKNKSLALKPENNELVGKSEVEINALDAILEEELSPIQGFLNAYLIEDFLEVMLYFRIALAVEALGTVEVSAPLKGNVEGQYELVGLPQTEFEKADGALRPIMEDPRMMGYVFNQQMNRFTLQVLTGFQTSIDAPIWRDVEDFTPAEIEELAQEVGTSTHIFRIIRTVNSALFQTPQIRNIFDKFDIEDKYIVV